jgi:hypothetical protein
MIRGMVGREQRGVAGITSGILWRRKEKEKRKRNGVGWGREEEREEPSAVASEQTGLLDKMT